MDHMYRVYRLTMDDGFVGFVAMSALREISFREQIARGELVGIETMDLVAETPDRNGARVLANGNEA